MHTQSNNRKDPGNKLAHTICSCAHPDDSFSDALRRVSDIALHHRAEYIDINDSLMNDLWRVSEMVNMIREIEREHLKFDPKCGQ